LTAGFGAAFPLLKDASSADLYERPTAGLYPPRLRCASELNLLDILSDSPTLGFDICFRCLLLDEEPLGADSNRVAKLSAPRNGPSRCCANSPAAPDRGITAFFLAQNQTRRLIVANNMTHSGPRSNFAFAARLPGVAAYLRDDPLPLAMAMLHREQAPHMYVDIVETDEGYLLTADVPGADREHITVIVDGNTVSIRADVEQEQAVPNRRMLAIERLHGQQVRTFTLPDEIDESRAEARVMDGVLVLRLPKKPRTRVEVRHGTEGRLARGPAPAQSAAGITAATVNLKINGSAYPMHLESRVTLLDALREYAHLYGTKKGCDQGQCGACTVHVNGRRVLSCLTLAVQAEGQEVVTIEGLAAHGTLHAMQEAFIRHDALQCGYCTPGQIMSAVACIAEGHADSDANIREYMSGNLCRCGTYTNIVAAVREMAAAAASNRGQAR
jgi:xanthine dehydrogenase YagT iron-sulfur-binding subunit